MSNSCAALITPSIYRKGTHCYVLEIETNACIHIYENIHNRDGFKKTLEIVERFKNTCKPFTARVLSTLSNDFIYSYNCIKTL